MIRALLDLFFPPLCISCGADASKSQLCNTCWELSAIIDPIGRCRHCFAPSEKPLCAVCTKKPELPVARIAVFEPEAPIFLLADGETEEAMAAFAYYQWQRLAEMDPEYVISLIPSQIAKAFANLCNKPSPKVFRRRFSWRGEETWDLNEGLISEDATILLFDPGLPQKSLELAFRAISQAFPRRLLLLSLRIATH